MVRNRKLIRRLARIGIGRRYERLEKVKKDKHETYEDRYAGTGNRECARV